MLDRIEQDTIQLDSMLETHSHRCPPGERPAQAEVRKPLSERSVENVLDDARFEAAATDATISYTGRRDISLPAIPACCAAPSKTSCATRLFYSGTRGSIDDSPAT